MDYGVMVREEGTVMLDDQEVLTYYLEERSNDIFYHALSLSHAQASRSERYG